MIFLSSTTKATLDLAKEWVVLLGDKVERDGEAERADGLKSKYFIAVHGEYKIVCVDSGNNTVTILGDLSLPKDFQEKLKKDKDQKKVEKLFKIVAGELLCRRSAYSFIPPNQLVPHTIRISQLIRINETDYSSFNRFSDGIQEIINALVMTMLILQTSVPLTSGSENISGSSFHDGMYG